MLKNQTRVISVAACVAAAVVLAFAVAFAMPHVAYAEGEADGASDTPDLVTDVPPATEAGSPDDTPSGGTEDAGDEKAPATGDGAGAGAPGGNDPDDEGRLDEDEGGEGNESGDSSGDDDGQDEAGDEPSGTTGDGTDGTDDQSDNQPDGQKDDGDAEQLNEDAPAFTVTFVDPLGGSAQDAQRREAGQSVTLPGLEADGYDFQGWKVQGGEHDGETLPAGTVLAVTSDMTLTAVWTQNEEADGRQEGDSDKADGDAATSGGLSDKGKAGSATSQLEDKASATSAESGTATATSGTNATSGASSESRSGTALGATSVSGVSDGASDSSGGSSLTAAASKGYKSSTGNTGYVEFSAFKPGATGGWIGGRPEFKYSYEYNKDDSYDMKNFKVTTKPKMTGYWIVENGVLTLYGQNSSPTVSGIPVETWARKGYTINVTMQSQSGALDTAGRPWSGCNATSVKFSGFYIKSASYLLSGMGNLKSVTSLSGLSTSTAEWSNFFYNCRSLEEVSVTISKSGADINYFLQNCTALKKATISTSNAIDDYKYVFSGCSNLEYVDISGLNPGNTASDDMAGMFAGCGNLTTLKLGSKTKLCSSSTGNLNVTQLRDTHGPNDGVWVKGTAVSYPILGSMTTDEIVYAYAGGSTKTAATYTWIKGFKGGILIQKSSSNRDGEAWWNFDPANGTLWLVGSNQNNSAHKQVCANSLTDVPWHPYRNQIKSVKMYNTVYPVNMDYWFANCVNLTMDNISIKGISGPTGKSAIGMFKGCTAMTTIDTTQIWNSTVTITHLNEAFSNCSNLVRLNLLRLNTGDVGSAQRTDMLYGDTKLEFITLNEQTRLSGANVQSLHSDFNSDGSSTGCWMPVNTLTNPQRTTTVRSSEFEKLTNSSYKNPNNTTWEFIYGADHGPLSTNESSTVVRWWFYMPGGTNYTDKEHGTLHIYGENSTASIDFTGKTIPWERVRTKTALVQIERGLKPLNMREWFKDFTNLERFQWVSGDSSYIDYLDRCFAGCTSLKTFNMNDFKGLPKIVSAESMFENCTSLTELDLTGVSFYRGTSTSDRTPVRINNMLRNCTSLKKLTVGSGTILSSMDNPNTSMRYDSQLITAHADDTGVWTRGTTPSSDGMPNPEEVIWTSALVNNYQLGQQPSGTRTYYWKEGSIAGLIGDNGDWWYYTAGENASDQNHGTLHIHGRNNTLDIGTLSKAPGWMEDRWNLKGKIVQVEFQNGIRVTDISGWFKGLTALKAVTFNGAKGGTVRGAVRTNLWNLSSAFEGCTSLTSVDLEGSGTFAKVSNVTNTFANCTSLSALNLTSMDMANVSSATGMLANCSSLKTLILNDTSNIAASNLPSGRPDSAGVWKATNVSSSSITANTSDFRESSTLAATYPGKTSGLGTITWVWEQDGVLLKFDANGGTGAYALLLHRNGSDSATFPDQATAGMELSGWHLAYWHLSPNGGRYLYKIPGDVFRSSDFPATSSVVTYYAIWAENKDVTIVFNNGAGDHLHNWTVKQDPSRTKVEGSMANITISRCGDLYDLSQVTNKFLARGYDFIGWNVDKANSQNYTIDNVADEGSYLPTDTIRLGTLKNGRIYADNFVLYTVWKPKQNYTVHYFVNGGIGVDNSLRGFVDKTDATWHSTSLLPATGIKREGLSLVGWYWADARGNYITDEANAIIEVTDSTPYWQLRSTDDPRFKSYSNAADSDTEKVYLIARWGEAIVQVKYLVDDDDHGTALTVRPGGAPNGSFGTYEQFGSITGRPYGGRTVAKPGYHLAYWDNNRTADRFTTTTLSYDQIAQVALVSGNWRDVEFTAHYLPNTFTVKYAHVGYDETGKLDDQKVTYGESFNLAWGVGEYVRYGYVIRGWTLNANGIPTTAHPMYDDGGKIEVSDWANLMTNPDGGIMRFYPVWEEATATYTYYASKPEGSVKGDDGNVYADGKAYTQVVGRLSGYLKDTTTLFGFVEAIAGPGYTFQKWINDATGDEVSTEVNWKPSAKEAGMYAADSTFRAVFAPKTFTVAFAVAPGDADAVCTVPAFTLKYGIAGTLPAHLNRVSRTGYMFKEWKDANSKAYADGASITIDAALAATAVNDIITLTAAWNGRPYAIEYNPGAAGVLKGNASTPATTAVSERHTYGDPAFDLTEASTMFLRSGYVFDYWSAKVGGEKLYDDKQNVQDLRSDGGIVSLYAVWKVANYTVTFTVAASDGQLADASKGTQIVKHGNNATVPSVVPATGSGSFSKMWEYRYKQLNGSFTKWATITSAAAATMPIVGDTEFKALMSSTGGSTYTVSYEPGKFGTFTTGVGTTIFSMDSGVKFYDPALVSGWPLYGAETDAFNDPVGQAGFTFTGWNVTVGGKQYTNLRDTSAITTTATDDNWLMNEDLTFVAQWSGPQFRVVYHVNGGTATASGASALVTSLYYAGDTVNVAPSGSVDRTAATFAGWSLVQDGAVAYLSGDTFAMPAADVNLYAAWDFQEFKLVFDSNGGSSVEGRTDVHWDESDLLFYRVPDANGVMVKIPVTDPVKEGYVFQGWYFSLELNAPISRVDSTMTYSTLANALGTSFTDTVTLRAKWEQRDVPIYYYATDRNFNQLSAAKTGCFVYPTFDAPASESAAINGSIAVAGAGYEFVGWFDASGDPVDPSWVSGQKITPVKSGPVWVNATYYAVFRAFRFYVEFDLNAPASMGATGSMDRQEFEHDIPENLRKVIDGTMHAPGYRIASWNTAPDGSGASFADGEEVEGSRHICIYGPGGLQVAPWGTVTLYAQWEIAPITVTLDPNGGVMSTTDPKTMSGAIGARLVLPGASSVGYTRAGYVLDGWSLTGSGDLDYAVSASYRVPNADVTLFAHWRPVRYTIRYQPNTGADPFGGTVASQTKEVGTDLPLRTGGYTREGYWFGGWSTTQARANAASFDASLIDYCENGVADQLENDLTSLDGDTVDLWAVWVPRVFEVRFESGNETLGSVSGDILQYVVTAGSPSVTGIVITPVDGYYFDNMWDWTATADDGTTKTGSVADVTTFDVRANIVFRARFSNKLTVIYDPGLHGAWNQVQQQYESGYAMPTFNSLATADAIVSNKPRGLDGWLFKEWAVVPVGFEVPTPVGSAAGWESSYSNLTRGYVLTAQWYKPASITFNKNSSSAVWLNPSASSVSGNVDDTKTAPGAADVQWRGYVLRGWSLGSADSTIAYSPNSSFQLPEDVSVLYAVWDKNTSYVVKYDNGDGPGRPDLTGLSWDSAGDVVPNTPAGPLGGGSPYSFVGWFADAAHTIPLTPGITYGDVVNAQNPSSSTADPASVTVYGQYDELLAKLTYTVVNTKAGTSGGTIEKLGWPNSATTTSLDRDVKMVTGVPEAIVVSVNTGYKFLGWYLGSTLVSNATSFVPTKDANEIWSDRTYEARFAPLTFTVHFEPGRGTGTLPDQFVRYTDSTPLTLHNYGGGMVGPAGSLTPFVQWTFGTNGTITDGGNADALVSAMDKNGVVTLTAEWFVLSYILSFSLNAPDATGGLTPGIDGQPHDAGLPVDLPTASDCTGINRTFWQIDGWMEKADGTGKTYLFTDIDAGTAVYTMPSANTTLYAHWTHVGEVYYVDFENGDPSGGDYVAGDDPASITLTGGRNVEENKRFPNYSYTRNGYVQSGWTFESDSLVPASVVGKVYAANDYIPDLVTSAGEHVVVVPAWTPQTITVTFRSEDTAKGYLNGSTTQTITCGSSPVPVTVTPASSNYALSYWIVRTTVATQVVPVEEIVYNADVATFETYGDPVEFIAVWRECTYKVIYEFVYSTGASTPGSAFSQEEFAEVDGVKWTSTGLLPHVSGNVAVPTQYDSDYVVWVGWHYTDAISPEVLGVSVSIEDLDTWTFERFAKAQYGSSVRYDDPDVTSIVIYGMFRLANVVVTYAADTEGIVHSNVGNRASTTLDDTVHSTNDNTLDGAWAEPSAGYHFVGWYSAAGGAGTKLSGNVEYRPSKKPTDRWYDGTTFYARFVGNDYKVHFDGSDNSAGTMTDQSFVYGEGAKPLSANAFSKVGHTFAGWATSQQDAEDGVVTYADKESVENLTTTNNGTVTLYAVWAVLTYQVRYTNSEADKNDGENSATGGTEMDWAWYNEVEGVNMNGQAFGPQYVYMKPWAINAYVTLPTYEQATVPEAGGKLVRPGYYLAGWEYNGTTYSLGSSNEFMMPDLGDSTTEITLYAVWKPAEFTVQFDKNSDYAGGTMNDMTVVYKSLDQKSYKLPDSTFTHLARTFSGWNTRADGLGDTYAVGANADLLSAVHGDVVVLYAIWDDGASKQVSITFLNGTGGTLSSPGNKLTQTIQGGTAPDITDFVYTANTGLAFKAFDYTMTTSGGTYTGTVTKKAMRNFQAEGNVTFTAIWGDSLSVTYLPGDHGDFAAYTVNSGISPSNEHNVPKYAGVMSADGSGPKGKTDATGSYYFAGWVDSSGALQKAEGSNSVNYDLSESGLQVTVTEDETFTATWKRFMNITYLPGTQGAFVPNVPNRTSFQVKDGANMSAYAGAFDSSNKPLGNKGWVFAGWEYKVGDATNTHDAWDMSDVVFTGESDIAITALWTQAGYLLHFAKGTVANSMVTDLTGDLYKEMDDQAFTYGTSANLSALGYKAPGYQFDGWLFVYDNGTTATFKDQDEFGLPNGYGAEGRKVVITAQWKKLTYTVIIVSGDDAMGTVTGPESLLRQEGLDYFDFAVSQNSDGQVSWAAVQDAGGQDEYSLLYWQIEYTDENNVEQTYVGYSTDLAEVLASWPVQADATVKAIWGALHAVNYYPGEHGAFSPGVKDETYFTPDLPTESVPAYDGLMDNGRPASDDARYLFWKWVDEADPDNEYTSVFGPTIETVGNGKSYTAYWTLANFTYQFVPQGGIWRNGYAKDVTLPTYSSYRVASQNDLTRDRFVLLGWATSSDGEVVISPGANITVDPDPTAPRIYYAIWSEATVNIEYDYETLPAGVFVHSKDEGGSIKPVEPKVYRTGTAGNWQVIGSRTGNVFDTDGAVLYNTPVTVRAVAAEGYEFAGWYRVESDGSYTLVSDYEDFTVGKGSDGEYHAAKYIAQFRELLITYVYEIAPAGFADSKNFLSRLTETLYGETGAAFGSTINYDKANYTFAGWYDAETGGNLLDSNEVFSPQPGRGFKSSQVFYARLERSTNVTWTVEYWMQDATGSYVKDYTFSGAGDNGDTLDALVDNVPYKVFEDSSHLGETTLFTLNTTSSYPTSITLDCTNPAGNVVKLYFDRVKFTVSYQYDAQPVPKPAGAPLPPATATYIWGEKVTVAPSVYYSGLRTDTWYMVPADTPQSAVDTDIYDPSKSSFNMPSFNVLLHARWVAFTQKLMYDLNGGAPVNASATDFNDVTAQTGSRITLPAANLATRDGYDFAGWSLLATATSPDYAPGQVIPMFSTDTTLYAFWKDKVITIVYQVSGSDAQYGDPPHGQIVNHDFTDGKGNLVVSRAVTVGQTLQQKIGAGSGLSYDYYTGALNTPEHEAFQIEAVPDRGYHFVHWTNSSGEEVSTNAVLTLSELTKTGDAYAAETYKAVFTENEDEPILAVVGTVFYDGNGAITAVEIGLNAQGGGIGRVNGTQYNSQSLYDFQRPAPGTNDWYQVESKIGMNVPGYTFLGWYEYDVNKIKDIIDVDESTGATSLKNVTLSDPSDLGSAVTTTRELDESLVQDGNGAWKTHLYVALYKHSGEVVEYKVEHVFMQPDGTYPTKDDSGTWSDAAYVSIATQRDLEGAEVTATATGRTGYTVDTNPLPKGTLDSTADLLVLTVYYKLNEHNVSYTYTGVVPPSATPPATVAYRYGVTVTVEGNPADIGGYTFLGWKTTDVTVSSGTFAMPDDDVVITGEWAPKPYSVKFLIASDDASKGTIAGISGVNTPGAEQTAYYGTNVQMVDPITGASWIVITPDPATTWRPYGWTYRYKDVAATDPDAWVEGSGVVMDPSTLTVTGDMEFTARWIVSATVRYIRAADTAQNAYADFTEDPYPANPPVTGRTYFVGLLPGDTIEADAAFAAETDAAGMPRAKANAAFEYWTWTIDGVKYRSDVDPFPAIQEGGEYVFTAVWSDSSSANPNPKVVLVNFDPNGGMWLDGLDSIDAVYTDKMGSPQVLTKTYTAGTSMTVPSATITVGADTYVVATYAGRHIIGWSTSPAGPASYLADGTDTYAVPSAETTLYLIWDDDPAVNIYYQAGPGGSVTNVMDTVAPLTGTPSGSTPIANPGFEFDKWVLVEFDISGNEVGTQDAYFIDGLFVPSVDGNTGLYEEAVYRALFRDADDVRIDYAVKTLDASGYDDLVNVGGSVFVVGGTATYEYVTPSGATSSNGRPLSGPPVGAMPVNNPGYMFLYWVDAYGTQVSKGPAFVPTVGANGVYGAATYYAVFKPVDKVMLTLIGNAVGAKNIPYDSADAKTGDNPITDIDPNTVLNPQNWYLKDSDGARILPALAGYTFLGWSATENATTPDLDKDLTSWTITADTVLYAVWQTVDQDIRFHSNVAAGQAATFYDRSGTVLAQDASGVYTHKVAENTYVFVPERYDSANPFNLNIESRGYTLIGWNTQLDGNGTYYDNTDNRLVAPAGGIDLYAIWQTGTVTIKFNAESLRYDNGNTNKIVGKWNDANYWLTNAGGTGHEQDPATITVTYNTTFTTPAPGDLLLDGFILDHWETAEGFSIDTNVATGAPWTYANTGTPAMAGATLTATQDIEFFPVFKRAMQAWVFYPDNSTLPSTLGGVIDVEMPKTYPGAGEWVNDGVDNWLTNYVGGSPTAVATRLVETDDSLTIPGTNDLVRNGYTLVRWTDATGTIIYTPGQSIPQTQALPGLRRELYPVWAARTQTLIAVPDETGTQGGRWVDDGTDNWLSDATRANGDENAFIHIAQRTEETVLLPGADDATRIGYVLVGWKINGQYYLFDEYATDTTKLESAGSYGTFIGIAQDGTITMPGLPDDEAYAYPVWEHAWQTWTFHYDSTGITAINDAGEGFWTSAGAQDWLTNYAGGNASADATRTLRSSDTLVMAGAADLRRLGYVLTGWKTADGVIEYTQGTPYATPELASGSIDLYPMWEPVLQTLVLTPTTGTGDDGHWIDDANGNRWLTSPVRGNGAPQASVSITGMTGSSVRMPDPDDVKRDGYKLIGWAIDSVNYYFDDKYVSTGDMLIDGEGRIAMPASLTNSPNGVPIWEALLQTWTFQTVDTGSEKAGTGTWADANDQWLTDYASGAPNADARRDVYAGASITMPDVDDLVLKGYALSRWVGTDEHGNSYVFAPGEVVNPTPGLPGEHIELQPEFVAVTQTLTFVLDDLDPDHQGAIWTPEGGWDTISKPTTVTALTRRAIQAPMPTHVFLDMFELIGWRIEGEAYYFLIEGDDGINVGAIALDGTMQMPALTGNTGIARPIWRWTEMKLRFDLADDDEFLYHPAWADGYTNPGGDVRVQEVVYLPGVNDAVRAGYTLTGWKDDYDGTVWAVPADGTRPAWTMLPASVTLTAQWQPDVQWLHYDHGTDDLVTGYIDMRKLTDDVNGLTEKRVLVAQYTFKRAGYTLIGWSETKGGPVQYRRALTRAKSDYYTFKDSGNVLYAVWQENQYKVHYDLQFTPDLTNGIDVDTPADKLVYWTEMGLYENVARAGYTFVGWFTGRNGTGVKVDRQTKYFELTYSDATGLYNGDVPDAYLFAYWEARSYKVHYVTQGGTPMPGDAEAYWEFQGNDGAYRGTGWSGRVTEMGGYEFLGWYTTRSSSNGVKVEPGMTYGQLTDTYGTGTQNDQMSDVYLYARWTPKTYTVVYDTQGGDTLRRTRTGILWTSSNLWDDTRDEATRAGYVFMGFYTEQNGQGVKVERTTRLSELFDDDSNEEPKVLYAHWLTYAEYAALET